MTVLNRKIQGESQLSEWVQAQGKIAPALAALRAVILLAGGVRKTRFGSAIGRSVLDLPIDSFRKIFHHWHEQVEELAIRLDRDELPLRVMVDTAGTLPTAIQASGRAKIVTERDPFEYRGTGGLLRDVATAYADEDFIVVANAGQVLLEPLADLIHQLASLGGDVGVVAHRDGTASGLMLIRCGTLRRIQAAGFADMKEQSLPAIAAGHDVRVLSFDSPSGLPIRTMEEYVLALRWYHSDLGGKADVGDPFAEDWRATFSIVEEGAAVDPQARVHDSVVLSGARVDRDAVLVRSVVCSGGLAKRDARVVNQLVKPV